MPNETPLPVSLSSVSASAVSSSQFPSSPARILIVDDDPAILDICRILLRGAGYDNIKVLTDSRGVLATFVEYDPDILILDISMPHLDGLQLLELLQHSTASGLSLPILVMTAFPTPEKRYQALRAGAVDILQKPFDSREFVLRVGNLLKMRLEIIGLRAQNEALSKELAERGEEVTGYQLKLKEAQLEVIARLARAGEQHDDDTGQHTQRVSVTSRAIAQALGIGEEEASLIQYAAPLHDVGKIGVPDSILLKPGKLTEEEFATMREHCKIGCTLLAGGQSEIVQVAERIALTHHEKWNGGGYPYGIEGEGIPLEGRILAVADVFDALTHERPYKKAWPVAEAVAEIKGQGGRQFDPRVVDAFMRLPHAEFI